MLPEHRITVLHYQGQQPPEDLLRQGVAGIEASERWRPWHRRTVWEAVQLPRLVRRGDVDLVLNVSGALAPRCPVPQAVLCQNPWCYRRQAHHSRVDRVKAALQRLGYAKAYRGAALMIYISHHLRSLYAAANPGRSERAAEVAYVGLDDATFAAAGRMREQEREPLSVLSVSAMARWKGAATLVQAIKQLRDGGLEARLKLVGPWPDAAHRAEIESLVGRLALADAVEILGKVDEDQLHRLYGTSRVFCLMSSCESYGIPAAEAMAFATPVVSTDCCAIAEVCRGAGQFGPVGDVDWTAQALRRALTDDAAWRGWSEQARENAESLRWDTCATPLRRLADLTPGSTRPAPSSPLPAPRP